MLTCLVGIITIPFIDAYKEIVDIKEKKSQMKRVQDFWEL